MSSNQAAAGRQERGRRAASSLGLSLVAPAIFLVAGCATPRLPTDQERASVWLAESPRTVAVSVDPELPGTSLVTRDHRIDDRVREAGRGMGQGALYGTQAALAAGETFFLIPAMPFLFIGGVVVGTGIGAVKAIGVESKDQHHPLESARGAPAVQGVANDLALPRELANALAVQASARGHRLEAAGEGRLGTGRLRLAFSEIALLGNPGEDSITTLRVTVDADLSAAGQSGYWRRTFVQKGSTQRISGWLADDAQLFKRDMRQALRAIAAAIVREQVDAAPASGAAAAVAAWSAYEQSSWDLAQAKDSRPAYENYLERYPDGKFAAQAKNRIAEVDAAAAAKAAERAEQGRLRRLAEEDQLKNDRARRNAEGRTWYGRFEGEGSAIVEPGSRSPFPATSCLHPTSSGSC